MLTECLGIPHVSTGEMLREGIRQGRGVARGCRQQMQAGFAGAGRSGGSAGAGAAEPAGRGEWLCAGRIPADAGAGAALGRVARTARGVRELVIHLAVDYNVIIARLTGRRECPRCGTPYNVALRPPKTDELCDLDGEKLVRRDDDREEVIRERLNAYDRQTRPVLEYLRETGRRILEVCAE